MDIQKDSLKTIGSPVTVSANQNIETDFILPDYYDTIGKLIKANVSPLCESVTIAGDKISVSGCAFITLLYAGEDNRLYQYENRYKYSKILQCENLEASDCVDVRQDVLNLSYRVIAPKRVEVKSLIRLDAFVYRSNNIEIISSVTDGTIETLQQEIEAENCEIVAVRDFVISGKDMPVDENIRFILRKDCKIEFSEIRTVSNKVYLRGNAVIDAVCLTEDESSVKKYSFNLPVSEVIDFYGISEESNCIIESVTPQTEISIVNKENSSSLDMSVQIYIKICSMNMKTYSFITDAYALRGEMRPVYSLQDIELKRETVTKTHSVSFETDLFEEGNFNIADVFTDNIKLSASFREGNIDCVFNADYNALIKSEKETYSFICRNNTSDFSIECKGVNKEIISVENRVLSASALQVGGGKIRYSADVSVSIVLAEKCKVNILTDVDASISENECSDSAVTLYYGTKGESIWNIGKENRVSVHNIRSNNSLSGDNLSEDTVLMFSNF